MHTHNFLVALLPFFLDKFGNLLGNSSRKRGKLGLVNVSKEILVQDYAKQTISISRDFEKLQVVLLLVLIDVAA